MQDSFVVLQMQEVLDRLASFAHTERGKVRFSSLRFLDKETREEELAYLREADEVIAELGNFPLCSSVDLSSRLDVAEKGGTLNANDFRAIYDDICCVMDLRRHCSKSTLHNILLDRIAGLTEEPVLKDSIVRVIAEDGSVKDGASAELRRIRGAILRKTREITTRLNQILAEHSTYLNGNSWTMRNGHYVLPVSSSHKNTVRGYVQDISASGSTVFIEPEALVRIHNEIAGLQAEEKEEVRRILSELSAEVGGVGESLRQGNELIGYVDFLQSKCLYGASIKGHVGETSNDGSLFLPGARHPLLDQSKVVANDFALSSSRRILILSGPNAGGKTVALKTLGILCYMHGCALMIPAGQGALLPDLGGVLLDIGDSQSIFDNLSTFSGHITHIKEILETAKNGDLVLLDEVGTGTSPKEGEALALAVVDALERRGCYALLSSHFEGLKAKALSSECAENASLVFDEETLSPTYRLRIGTPGESYGLEVARRLGLSEEVLAQAEEYLASSGDESVASSLRHLAELQEEEEAKLQRMEEREARMRELEKELRRERRDLERQLRHQQEEFQKEREELLAKAQEEVDAVIRELSRPGVKLHEVIAAKKRLDALEGSEGSETFKTEVGIGDYVEIPAFGVDGRITKEKGNRIDVTTREGLVFKAKKEDARPIEAPQEEKESKKRLTPSVNIDAAPTSGLPLELNMIGMRVEEAMSALDHYLDQCRLKGYKRVRIIHGFGSGALRKATHEYLKKHSRFVERFELCGEFEGGAGATAVYLK